MPVLTDGLREPAIAGMLPDDAPEADVIEQRTDVEPGSEGYAGITAAAEVDAADADLIEQALTDPVDHDEDYPRGREEDL
ncbi:hypothetical protein HWD94_12730 [Pseudarthrobacter equi]|nr:hypothetical protein [Pseudarthrobacter equi]